MIFLTSFWLGILTSISPCPLATNIAAVSYVGKRIDNPRAVLLNGLFYTFGRTLFYVIVGITLAQMIQSIPAVSLFLQRQMMWAIGPVMILMGLMMLNIFPITFSIGQIGQQKSEKMARKGVVGSFALGILFAAALCPVSAALYFSSLINSGGNPFALLLYGIGTGVPVIAFSLVLAFGFNGLSVAYKLTTIFEKYARLSTAIIFICVGAYSVWRLL